MRQAKPGDSRCGYSRDVYGERHGLTVSTIQQAQAAKLTELNDRSVRLGGTALSLGDPRVTAGQIERLAGVLRTSVLLGSENADDLADALVAQVIALRLARARVQALDITAGDAA